MILLGVARKPSERRDRWTTIGAVARPHRGRLTAIAAASFIGGFVEAGFLVVVTQTALGLAQQEDRIELAGRWPVSVATSIAIAGVLVVIRAALALYGVWASSRLGFVVGKALRIRLANAFLHASWSTQQAEPSGRLQQLVSGFALSAVGVLRALTTSITSSLSLFALITVALVVDPLATMLVVVALMVLGSVLAPLRRAIRRRSAEAAQVTMSFATGVSEFGALGLEMQAYGVRQQFSDRIAALVHLDSRASLRAEFLRSSVAPIYTTLGYLAILTGLGAAAAVGIGSMTTVSAVMLVMLRSLSYGQALQLSMANLISAIPFLEVVDETLERYESDQAPGGPRPVERVGVIEAAEMSFHYPESDDVLRGMCFSIVPGEHIGIVGPSGSGKSTLVQLLLGLREPTGGMITVDGVDLASVDRSTWTPRIAFVAQDAQLFHGTIAENIAFFRDTITRDDIETAALHAQLLSDLAGMPNGFDTDVGERGTRLSGGQRQRVSIARALAGHPDLLILDEPTSALDVRSEIAIREMLANLRGRVTVIVIAHRMSTLEMCDRVMVIQDGEIRAIESPATLATTSAFYREALELSRVR